MDDGLSDENAWVLLIEPKLLSPSGEWYEINQLLFADDRVTPVDSEEKLCRLASAFGIGRERRKL